MASREKRPIVPSKSKQKANNDSGLPSSELRNRKAKSLSNLKIQQLACDILEAVATGSQLHPKLEAGLPRKKVLRNLKRKQKLRVAKASLIKSKVTRRVANKNLCRINTDIKRGLRKKRLRLAEEESNKSADSSRASEVSTAEGESVLQETPNRSAKNNLRTKKSKVAAKTEADTEHSQDTDPIVGSNSKVSPKLSRKGRSTDSPESSVKGAKPAKFSGFRRNNIRQRETYTRSTEVTRGRRSQNKEADFISAPRSNSDTKFAKPLVDSKNSIDLTIDEVIASMLSDSEIERQQAATDKVEGKVTRSRKMLVEESTVADVEIKKEPDGEDVKSSPDGDSTELDQGAHHQNAIQLRKRSQVTPTQRSLRNGKLRQLSDSGISLDLELKRHRRSNSDEPATSDVPADHSSDCNVDTESCFSESSGIDSQTVSAAAKDDSCLVKESEECSQTGSEVENNNNSDRVDRTGEIGPTLRSKTKAKSTEGEGKNEDIKVEYVRIVSKSGEVSDEQKKTSSMDQVRKDNILAKFTDKSKARRSSLNIDMKKTVNSFYGTDKSDGNPKSQIDQMIENIKLTIAKSIESKIFGPEKGLGLTKNFDIPKTEEIIAPLSAESQKLGLEENADEDKPNVTKNEIKSEGSENSVPKVADTAKEIEKLVMGDIEPTETHSQNVEENVESSERDTGNNNGHDVSEASRANDSTETSCGTTEQQQQQQQQQKHETSSDLDKSLQDATDSRARTPDDSKKSATIRKSPRITDKVSLENTGSDNVKKLNRIASKVQKSESTEEVLLDSKKVPISNELSISCESPKDESFKKVEESADNDTEALTELLTSSKELGDKESEKQSPEIKTSEPEISMARSDQSDESETLESISQEVERLVAEDQTSIALPIITEDVEKLQPETSTLKASNEDNPEGTGQPALESTTSTESTTETVPDGNGLTNNVTTENGSETVTRDEMEASNCSTETSECTKKDKENCNISSATVCDSNSEHNTTNPEKPSVLEETTRNVDVEVKEEKCREDDAEEEGAISTITESTEDEENVRKNPEQNGSTPIPEPEEKSTNAKDTEEQKSAAEDKRRVLRTRDKSKKIEKRPTSRSRERSENSVKPKTEEEKKATQESADNSANCLTEDKPETSNSDEVEDSHNAEAEQSDSLETQGRTRRSREIKRRKEDQLTLRTKRAKREVRKSEQQNKEETLLDNEVAKINENNRSFLTKYRNGNECAETFRGFSEGGRGVTDQAPSNADNARSKSENDLIITNETKKSDDRLSRNLSEDHVSKETDNIDIIDTEDKVAKTPETSPKDSDEASTSGESSSSTNVTPKILETPEDKAKKESILRLLGLESLEKAAERLNHQKARKEQYTGTLKTVIRVQKEKDKDKRASRSPLKMVLKQGRGDGEGDSPDFYTIQKEFGTSGLGDSSSGANRKFTTNHRHSCDEDNEDTAPKDRQSLVIPEKSSSFSIHPGRLCADDCCYCFGKFGSLDTPMHLAQMKSDERRKKILNIERHLTKDSCLCDACYRHIDRKANTSPTNLQAKPPKQHRQLMVSKCTARDCRDPARHHVKRRWLLKIKAGLQNQVDIDWDASQHTSLSFCVTHYSKIERFLTCALCTRRLARNHTHQLATAETDELNQLLGQQGIPVLLAAGTFVCKLCRYFTQLQLKYKDVENMNANHRSFFKSYRKRVLHYHDIEVLENEDEESSQNQAKSDKEKRKKAKAPPPKAGPTSKSPDVAMNSPSEKSTPEPNKTEGGNSELDGEHRGGKTTANEETVVNDVQFLGIESAVEKLKKRKMLDMHTYSTDTTISCDGSNEVVEILAMDKEVTLTRLPKRPRTNNDIAPVVQRLGANPSISVRTLFPGEEEMNLHANIEFTNVREVTPQGWEKCATMIQYDRDTKLLWQELQRPYGNQSSFLRHLILLEKYYRSGDLVLAPNASRNAINYSTSVQNRLISYEGPEKMDEPIMEPIAAEYSNSRRLSGGFVLERDRLALPGTSSVKLTTSTIQSTKGSPPRVLKLNPGVSIIKKPPPNLQRLNIPSTSTSNGNLKRKDGPKITATSCGGKIFQMSEPEFKRLQNLKKQKQMLGEKQPMSPNSGSGSSNSPPSYKSATQYQKVQMVAQSQFQKHLIMQQEMLNRQSRGDFEPLICDVRSMANENSPTQNVLHNLNLPKSIQVTTKPSHPIPILPKIPKSLTVIPQTVTRPTEK